MKPRIKKIEGMWCVLKPPQYPHIIDYLAYVEALNFCIMLNNRK